MVVADINSNELYDFLVSVISSAPYGILAMNHEGDIVIANFHAKDYLELPYEMNELHEKNITECINHIPRLKNKIVKSFKNGRKPFNLESFAFNNKYLTVKGRLIREGYLVTIENITRLKEIEAASLNSTFKGQELERTRLAKEIHDGLGPVLSSAKLNLETLYDDLRDHGNNIALKRLENAISMIDSVTTDVRNLSRDLMPKVLDDFGLSEALDNLCHYVDHSNRIKVNFYSSVNNKRFDKVLEFGFYRIAQELINNAIRHSKATIINVQLIEHPESILLMIEDNGNGFDENSLNIDNQGIGLLNIESRAKALGGEFYIDSVEGKGVTATVEVPL